MPLFSMFPLFEKYLDRFSALLFRSGTPHPDVVPCSDDILSSEDDEQFSDAQQDHDTGIISGHGDAAAVETNARSNLFVVALPPSVAESAATAQKTVCPDGDKSLVIFQELRDAIEFCKKNKSASPRWKQVANTREAECFSSNLSNATTTLSDANENRIQMKNSSRESVVWRMPPSQETVKLRKSIESDTVDDVRAIINSNPRFLIGSGDTPTVLQEGCRYNACHIAAKADRADMLSLVIGTLRDESFMKMMYPNDSDETTRSRMAFLIDLYLNMPDKTRKSETPLHFACKFGAVECVRILLDQPECDRSVRNGEGLEAHQIICERVSGQPGLARKMRSLFEERFVIPILRDEDDDCPPQVGAPVTPKQLNSMFYSTQKRTPRSGKKVSALVGPVTSPVASEVMADLRTARLRPLEMQIRRTDAEKGLERIARQVARRHGAPWTERWDFLDCSIDLSSSEGLEAFENYLKLQYDKADDVTFIMGDRPTKTDYHVWIALKPILHGIDRLQLSFIGRWTDNLSSYTGDEMKLWATPIKSLTGTTESEKGAGDGTACVVNLMSRFSTSNNN